jgi:hypothetical protein
VLFKNINKYYKEKWVLNFISNDSLCNNLLRELLPFRYLRLILKYLFVKTKDYFQVFKKNQIHEYLYSFFKKEKKNSTLIVNSYTLKTKDILIIEILW